MASQGDDHVNVGDGRAGGPGSSPSTGEQVEAARAAFAARREAENVLADASKIRASAAADADALLVDAQIMADRLQSESLAEYERLVREATERSDGILARARMEADRLRAEAQGQAEAIRLRAESQLDQMRAQVREELRAEQMATLGTVRHRSDGLLRDLESGVLDLGTTFERANASVADVVATIGQLRTVTESALPAAPAPATEPASDLARTSVLVEEPVTEPVTEPVIAAAPVVEAPVAEPVREPVVEDTREAAAPEQRAVVPTPTDEVPDRDHEGREHEGQDLEGRGPGAAAGEAPMIGRISTAAVTVPQPVADENATSFLGTDPPRPVTDWATGPAATAGGDPVAAPLGAGEGSRPLGWLFRATS